MKKSQKEAIWDYLRGGMSLTGLEALQIFGTMKLTTRISELRAEGKDIKDRVVDRNGKKFKRYFVVKA